jgi:hypothetical protein
MNTLVNVGRYHLVDRFTWVAMPWGIMAFSFLVNIGVSLAAPAGSHGIFTGGLASLYVFLLLCGALTMTRALPFGMMGISRRAYYADTALWSPWSWGSAGSPPCAGSPSDQRHPEAAVA